MGARRPGRGRGGVRINLWLARHCRAAAPQEIAIGWTDVPLADSGRAQARALSERLAGLRLDRIYASDLSRSLETAEIVAEGRGLPVEPARDLRELDFGAWEGRRLEDLWSESPAEARAWESDLTRLPAAFGETFAEFEARIHRFAAGLPERGNVLVVAHRGSLAVLHAHLCGVSVADAWGLRWEFGEFTRLELT